MEQPSYPAPEENPAFRSPVVMTTQPTMVPMPRPVYTNYMPWSIWNMIFCCLPLGTVGLIFSMKTQDAAHHQDVTKVSRYSRSAFRWNLSATLLGICIHVTWIGVVVFFHLTGGFKKQTMHNVDDED
ncbi:hypothetical protein GDO81_014601 [Engystomops pustulosus]|uniref:Uncharacterized protein n=1 Tax=Engystomops pustulosus TaxID=76066 RepID=A0AAV7BBY8_ENGPU|nr:hypothetical protein GDO81_014601 [Engystomops pustulosus]